MSQPDVRAGRPTDVDVLTDFAIASAAESEGLALDHDTVRAATAAGLDDLDRARYFLAEIEGTPVGSCFVTPEWSDWRGGWYWWIQAVYVRPEHRRKGVWSTLHAAVMAAAADGDVRRVRLYVERENAAAIAAYRRVGMQDAGYLVFEAEAGHRTG